MRTDWRGGKEEHRGVAAGSRLEDDEELGVDAGALEGEALALAARVAARGGGAKRAGELR